MTETGKSNTLPSVVSYDDVRAVSPVLEYYTETAEEGVASGTVQENQTTSACRVPCTQKQQ
jgi:hypothetical protein